MLLKIELDLGVTLCIPRIPAFSSLSLKLVPYAYLKGK